MLALTAMVGVLALVGAAKAVRAYLADPAERGAEALAAGDYRSARVDFMAVLADQPLNVDARIALARALNGLERGVEAERQLERARELGARTAAVRTEAARSQLVQGRAADALATLAGPVQASDATRAVIVAAQAHYRLGNLAAAARAFDRVAAANDREGWVAIARYRLAEQDMLGADDAATRAWVMAPDSAEAWTAKADVVLARAGPVAALPWYEAALERNANHLPALLSYAAALGEAGRARAMLAPLRRAAGIEPGNPRALYLQAALAARGGEPALARTLLRRIDGSEAERPGVLQLRAAVDLMLDRPAAARDAAAALIARQPDNVAARRLLALALSGTDDFRGTIAVLDPLTTRGDADSWSLLLLSRSFSALGWTGDAVQPLDRAASLTRGDAAPLAGAGDGTVSLEPRVAVPAIRAYLASGQGALALPLAQALASSSPGVAQAHLLVGDAAGAVGDASRAVAAYRTAGGLRADAPTMLRLVAALARTGDRAGAAEALAAYGARWPADPTAMRVRAAMAAEAGDWPRAEAALEAAIARSGSDALLLSQLARARIERGDARGALGPARAAYRLMPGNAAISGVYGRALAVSGEGSRTDAADLLRKAVRLAPDDVVLRRWRADLR